jgi:hypothetical protein
MMQTSRLGFRAPRRGNKALPALEVPEVTGRFERDGTSVRFVFDFFRRTLIQLPSASVSRTEGLHQRARFTAVCAGQPVRIVGATNTTRRCAVRLLQHHHSITSPFRASPSPPARLRDHERLIAVCWAPRRGLGGYSSGPFKATRTHTHTMAAADGDAKGNPRIAAPSRKLPDAVHRLHSQRAREARTSSFRRVRSRRSLAARAGREPAHPHRCEPELAVLFFRKAAELCTTDATVRNATPLRLLPSAALPAELVGARSLKRWQRLR